MSFESNQSLYSSENKQPNVKVLIVSLALILGLSLGILLTTIYFKVTQNNQSQRVYGENTQIFDTQFINEIYKIFQDEYIGEIPDKNELTYGVVKGLISSLNDPYTFFLDPEETKDYLSSRSPNFEGIGITLRYLNNNTEVETVLSGYPAESAGIKSGDIIVKVDEESVEGIQPNVVASKIRGEKGTDVVVGVYRPSESRLIEFKITRTSIEISNVNYEKLDDGVYRINISQFIDESVEKFNRSWNDVVNKILADGQPKSIIVDLRNNPGGYVDSVKYVLEEFLPLNSVLMSEETREDGVITFRDQRVGKFESVELVVLVNEGSASASEIFAGAIQDNQRGSVVGNPTVGKGVEQKVISGLPNDSLLVIVFQKWLTPSGKNVTKDNPIKPDLEVNFSTEDFNAGIDTQLNAALETLEN